jgi:hypothetical protein
MLKNRYVLCLVSMVAVYLLLELIQVNHFLRTVLRGHNYYYYYLLYMPALFVFIILYAARSTSFQSLWRLLAFGAGAGYIAGLFAQVFMAFSMGDGAKRIANSTRDIDDILIGLAAPLLYMSWLYGVLVVLGIRFAKRRWSI